MISNIISEDELRQKLAFWMLENDKGTVLPIGMTKEEFGAIYPIPDTIPVHTQTALDSDGILVTLLKSEIVLKDWETRNGREQKKFIFYKVLKSSPELPDVEPFPAGYITVY